MDNTMSESPSRRPSMQPDKFSLSPDAIHMTVKQVPEQFSDSHPLAETLKHILYGKLRVEDMQPIQVAHVNRQWYVIKGNRRLFIFKLLSRYAPYLLVNYNVSVEEINYVPECEDSSSQPFLSSMEEYNLFESDSGKQLETIIQQWKQGPFYKKPAKPATESDKASSPGQNATTATTTQNAGNVKKKKRSIKNPVDDDMFFLDCAEKTCWWMGRCFKCGFYFIVFSFLFLHVMSQFYMIKKQDNAKDEL